MSSLFPLTEMEALLADPLPMDAVFFPEASPQEMGKLDWGWFGSFPSFFGCSPE